MRPGRETTKPRPAAIRFHALQSQPPKSPDDPLAGAPTPRAYGAFRALLRILSRAFFRSVEVVGAENIPTTGGGLFVSWHPNGLIDPLLILCNSPRTVVFGARQGLFETRILGSVIRALGTVPLHRPQDPSGELSEDARRAANERSLAALAAAASKDFVALFPEGATHDEPQPLETRSGAARLFLQARSLAESEGSPSPHVVPVGLHYDHKHAFRSRALVVFHPPLDVPKASVAVTRPAEKPSDDAEVVEALNRQISKSLHEVVHATETWRLHALMQRAASLLRAERSARAGVHLPRRDMRERVLAFERLWVGYNERIRSHPEETRALFASIGRYHRLMRVLRLDDEDLDLGAAGRIVGRRISLRVLEAIVVYLFLPPLVLLGYIVNLPIATALDFTAKRFSATRTSQAGIKVALGALCFPLAWLLAAGLITAWPPAALEARGWLPSTPMLTYLVALVLCVVGGALALRYQRMAIDLYKALRTLVTQARRVESIRSLRRFRSELADELLRLAEGLSLPGEVLPDGRVRTASDPTGVKSKP